MVIACEGFLDVSDTTQYEQVIVCRMVCHFIFEKNIASYAMFVMGAKYFEGLMFSWKEGNYSLVRVTDTSS